MIAKIVKGHEFRGVLDYVAHKVGAVYLGGNVSENPKQAASEMGALRQYSGCEKPVWHCSLSLSPEDRDITDDDFLVLSEKFLQKMGITNHQYTIYKHTDRAHPHVHIIVNRIGLGLQHHCWNPWQDVRRARKAKTELEIEYKLKKVPHNPQFAHPEITRGEREEAKRHKIIPNKEYVASAIASASNARNVRGFVEQLKNYGIHAIPNISSTGRMNGFCFVFCMRHYKGSKLRCSWRELSDRLNYMPQKDNDFLFSLLPEEKRPSKQEKATTQKAARLNMPHDYRIYSAREWKHMGGDKDSNYRRIYKMLDGGYTMKSCAQELRLQNPGISERQIQKTLQKSAELWIMHNREKLAWAYAPQRCSIRFSNNPAEMLAEVLILLIAAAIRAGLRGIERHRTEGRINSLSNELLQMKEYAETTTQKRLQRIQLQDIDRGGPLIQRIECSNEIER